jgi:prevent-host-death family protein
MPNVTIHEAKTHLSRLIKEALAGGDVTITQGRTGEELVKLVPAKPTARKRQFGWLAHTIPAGKDPLEDGFWDPLPEDELALWNGEGPQEEWEKDCSSTPTR